MLASAIIQCLPKVWNTLRTVSKRGRDTESDANIQQEEMLHIFLKRMFHLHFQLKSAWCASYNIPYRLKAAARPMQQSLLLQDKSLDHLGDRIVIVVVLRHVIRCGFHLRRGILYRYPDMRRIKHLQYHSPHLPPLPYSLAEDSASS